MVTPALGIFVGTWWVLPAVKAIWVFPEKKRKLLFSLKITFTRVLLSINILIVNTTDQPVTSLIPVIT